MFFTAAPLDLAIQAPRPKAEGIIKRSDVAKAKS
jgi:hypothetical protein